MIDRIAFEGWVKFMANNLYDYAALETHPLTNQLIKVPATFNGAKGDYIRRTYEDAIEKLRPAGKDMNPSLPEWRPYLILRQRYVDGISMPDLAANLAVSERQLRRDQHRALLALAATLWDTLSPAGEDAGGSEPEGNPFQFAIHRQAIQTAETVQAVLDMLRPHLKETGQMVNFESEPSLPPVYTDRIILRQILIGLINGALHSAQQAPLRLSLHTNGPEVELRLRFESEGATSGLADDTLDTLRQWAERIGSRFISEKLPGEKFTLFTITLGLPRADQRTVLVVDDQESAINLFRRFLARTGLVVAGETNPHQIVETAARLRPALIILDIMMPQTDGWEALQALRINEDTQDAPVLICSAWEEPELARSLGAIGFLKKPITQKMVLDELTRLGVEIEPPAVTGAGRS